MPRTTTLGELEYVLSAVGFVAVPTTGQQKVFRHHVADALVVLPDGTSDMPLRLIQVAAVRRLVDEKGVVEADAFDRLLEASRGVETAAASD